MAIGISLGDCKNHVCVPDERLRNSTRDKPRRRVVVASNSRAGVAMFSAYGEPIHGVT